MNSEAVRAEDVRRAVAAVREAEAAAALAALAYDVLSRQAEGRALFAGREYVEARADAHDVAREKAETSAGNLRTILERGPESALERALVAAFAVRGLGDKLAAASEEERAKVLERFVRHAEWLELATPHAVYPFVGELLAEDERQKVWDALARSIVEEDAKEAGKPDADVAARARIAARLAVLAGGGEPGRAALEWVAAEAKGAGTRELARVMGGGAGGAAGDAARDGDAAREAVIEGRVARVRGSGVREILRVVTGWALLVWAARTLGAALGLKREARVELGADALRIHRKTHLLGRTIREVDETYTLSAIAGAARDVRYASLHLLVGATALALGVLLGGVLAFDGIRSGDVVLLVAAAVVILVGAGLDLALDVLVPATRNRVALDLRMLPQRTLRLSRIERADADRFLAALAKKISR